jgi:cytochrome b-561
MGLLTYAMALITAETGFLEKMTFLTVNKVIGRYSMEAMFVNSIALLLVVYGMIVILVSIVPKATKTGTVRSPD